MASERSDDLVQQTVRLVLDDVCAAIAQDRAIKNDDVTNARCQNLKLVDYGTTEAEESGDEMENGRANVIECTSVFAGDVVFASKQLDGSLLGDESEKIDSQLPRASTGDDVIQGDVSGDDSDSDSSDSSLFSDNEKGVSSESSSDVKSESADEESEAECEESVLRRVEKKCGKNEVVKTESGDSDTGATNETPPKVEGELQLDELPTVSLLDFVLSTDDELDKIGSVHSIVETLVVVESRPMLPALDTDSVLWKSDRRPLGSIFETFGPVQSPYYSIRFQSRDQIEKCGIATGKSIFYAPNNKQYTRYVFTHQLMQLKGSDASWEDDVEPPPEAVDFSDDETEMQAQKQERQWKQQNTSLTQNRDGRKRPRRNVQRQQRWQHSDAPQFRPPSQPSGRPRPHHRQTPQFSVPIPRVPSSIPQPSYPVYPQPTVTPPQQPMPLILPGFVMQDVQQESSLSSVFYRPPPPGHVESYQQCYIMSQQGSKQSQ